MGTIALVNLLPGIVIYPDQCVGQKRRAATFLSVYRDSCSDDASCADGFNFAYREELVMNSLADYILQARKTREDPGSPEI